MISVKVTVNGSKGDPARQIKSEFNLIEKKMPVAMAAGMFQAAQLIMRDAKRRAPKETGTMADSGYVAAPEIRGNRVHIDMGFGGPNIPPGGHAPVAAYVARQHYDTGLKHNNGEAMFFQNAQDAGAELYRREVTKAVYDFMRGKGVTLNRLPDIPASFLGTK
jgi:hypothetical protein